MYSRSSLERGEFCTTAGVFCLYTGKNIKNHIPPSLSAMDHPPTHRGQPIMSDEFG